MAARNLYIEVTQRIIAELERGAAPWVKPWAATPGRNTPHNAATGRPYSGINVMLLWMTHYETPAFLTYKQALALGGNVRKGEHGTKVYFVKPVAAKPKDGDEANGKGYMVLREYTVFNVAQCENLPPRIIAPKAVKAGNERDLTIEAFIQATGADYREGAGGDRAFYSPGGDFVAMPAFAAFKTAAGYYGTAFHELGHWTGGKARLGRDFAGRFGDRAYAAEELVAELTAAYLCAEFDIDGELRHAGYIESWITLLKDDPKAIFTAASKAQQAADHLRGLALQDQKDGEHQLAA
jgi:antirestriction protein ArdC